MEQSPSHMRGEALAPVGPPVVAVDLDTAVTFLEKAWDWPGRVLARSRKGAVEVFMADVASTLGLGTRVLERQSDSVVILGLASRRRQMAYRLTRAGAGTTVTPVGVLLPSARIGIALTLLLLCGVPVLLAPLAYRYRRKSIERLSATHLTAFCDLLEAELGTSTIKKGNATT